MAKTKNMQPTRIGPETAGAGFAVRRPLPGRLSDRGLAMLLALLALIVRVVYLLESNIISKHVNSGSAPLIPFRFSGTLFIKSTFSGYSSVVKLLTMSSTSVSG